MRIHPRLFGLLSFFTLFFTGALKAEAPEEKVLNVYNWAEYISPTALRDFTTSTGIKIVYDTFDSNETLLAKLQAGATGYDVIFPSDYMVNIMRKSGMLAPLDHAKLKNLGNMDPKFMNQEIDPGNKYSVPYMWGTTGIAVRIDKVKTPIDSWMQLFKPPAQIRGRLSMLNDMRDAIGSALKALGYSYNSTNPAEIQKAKELLIAQKESVKVYDSSSTYKVNLDTAEVWIGQAWNGDVSSLYWKGNRNVRYILPKEGGTIYFESVAIPKTAPHKDNAHKFIDFLMNPRTAADVTNFTYYATCNKAARGYISKNLLEDKTIFPPESLLKKYEFSKDVGAALRLYEEAWMEVKMN
jgi:spermidine/putrescine transport system substrate-binding protein